MSPKLTKNGGEAPPTPENKKKRVAKAQDGIEGKTQAEDRMLRVFQTMAEVNCLNNPLFILHTKGLKKASTIEYQELVETGDGVVGRYWQVTANAYYGLPGPFDRKVFRALESILSELGKPISNPIKFSLYDMAKRMAIEVSGQSKRAIKLAFQRIVATTIRTKGTLYSKQERRYFSEKTFHLFDAVVFHGEELPDGTIAETNYVFLNEVYRQSINVFYVRVLDYQYLMSLNSNLAQRFYELLGGKFYGAQNKNSNIRYRYSTLCQLLPVTRYNYLSDAKRSLNEAFNELTTTGYFASLPLWEKTSKSDDWYITFFPGTRVFNEIQGPLSKPQGEEYVLKASVAKVAEVGLEPLPPAPPPDVSKTIPTPSRESILDKAREIVLEFYRTLHRTDDVALVPSKKDIALARQYLEHYGEEILKQAIADLIKHARATNWDVRSFGAIQKQIIQTASVYQDALQQQKQQEQFMKEEKLLEQYEEYVAQEIQQIMNGQQRVLYQKIMQEEMAHVLQKAKPNVSLDQFIKTPTFKDVVNNLVCQRLVSEGYVLAYEDWRQQPSR